jgi:SAM-dependent methyltransferase
VTGNTAKSREPRPSYPDKIYKLPYQIIGDVQDTHARLADLVGQGRRVLALGGSIAPELNARGCRVVAVVEGPSEAGGEPGPCERVIAADLDGPDLTGALPGDRFDAVVAPDLLGRLRDPASVLRCVRDVLNPDGCLVASVPNVAHGSVRLALLGGQFLPGERDAHDRTRVRFFTRDALVRLLEEAGFVVGHIETTESPIHGPDAPIDAMRLPAGLLDELARDPDARADQFLVVAHPVPDPALGWIQDRLRQLAARTQTATLEAGDLRRAVTSMDAHIAFLYRRAEESAAREREARAKLLEAHDRLARQDDQARATAKELAAQRDALQARLNEREGEWQAAVNELVARRDDEDAENARRAVDRAARREEEWHALVGRMNAERDVQEAERRDRREAEWEAVKDELNTQREALQARLADVERHLAGLMQHPWWRLYRKVRGRLPNRGR